MSWNFQENVAPKRIAATLAAFFILFLVSVIGLHAQTSNGILAGAVTDTAGGAVTDATVTAVSVENGATRVTKTSGEGAFRIEEVLPGAYTVTVEATGFEKFETHIRASASAVTSVNASLKAGSQTETVTVTASSQILDTDTGSLSGTIGPQEIQTLPVSALNPYTLATTLPGVTTLTGVDFANGPSFSVNGTRPRGNNFLIEGQDNNDAGIHGQALQPENLEAIDEVTIFTNSYQAEFGHGGSSVSNLIFKSGTNQFHGVAWDRLLNSSLDAEDKSDTINGADKPKSRENIFGFFGSGPIVRNKLFVMGSFQWDRARSDTPGAILILPTAAGIATLKSLPTNPRITTLLQAIGDPDSYATHILPTPSNPGYDGSIPLGLGRPSVAVGGYQRTLPSGSNATELDLKGDWTVNPKDSLGLRLIRAYSIFPFDPNTTNQLPGFDADQGGVAYNAGITETHVFSPSVLNEFRLSYGRIGFTFDFQPATYANPLLAPTVGIAGLIDTGLTSGTTSGFGAPSGDPQGRFHNNYQAQDSVSWTKGSHFFKIGADVADIRVGDQVPFNFYGSISYEDVPNGFSGLANYIDDFGGNNGTAAKDFGSPKVSPQLIFQNYFAQDSWKVKPNLSVEIGVRYEYSGAPFNKLKYPALNSNDPTCFPCRVTEQPDTEDWGPRFGFAYTPKAIGDGKFVVRGGFGVFYDNIFTNIADNIQASSPNDQSGNIVSQVGQNGGGPRGLPNFSQQLANIVPAAPSPLDTAEFITPHLLSPETLQWNLNVEQQLPGAILMRLGYVGTRAEHIFATTEFNPYTDTGDRLFPTRGRMIRTDNSADSMYHAAELDVKRTLNHGLFFEGAYTFSRYMDDESEVFTDSAGNWSTYAVEQYPSSRKKTDWGRSAYDHRQRLSVAYGYTPPKWHADGAMKAAGYVVNGWTLGGITALQSGGVGNVEVGYDVNQDGIGNDRPTLGNSTAPLDTYAFDAASWGATDASGNPVAPGTYCEGKEFWWTDDPCNAVSPKSVHWLVPAFGSNGSPVTRNVIPTKGTTEWDLNVGRTFPIYEKHSLDFAAEIFNLFNHGDVGIPSFTLTSGLPFTPDDGPTTFNEYARTVSGGRTMRILLRYSF